MPLLVEAGWGGLVQAPETITWTDITPYVDTRQGVSINRGASDELSEIQPGSASLRLDNQDGRFTPGNVLSPYSPFVRRNAPIRVSVALIPTRTGSAPWPLAMLGDDFDDGRQDPVLWSGSYGSVTEVNGRARIPSTPGGFAAYQTARSWTLTGSKLTAKLVTLPGANGSSEAHTSMFVNSLVAGTRLGWAYDAATGLLKAVSETGYFDAGATALTYSGIDHLWLRVRQAAGLVYWETSGDGFIWTVRRTLATPAWVTTDTLVMDLSTSRTGGTGDYAEWDLVGADVNPRFWGMVNDWPVRWEGLESTVTISATDLFKRLNRLPVLRSCLSEEILASAPLAYYPLTEPQASTSAGDLSGTTAGVLTVGQVGVGGTIEFGSGTGPASTGEACPVFTPASTSVGKYLTADLGATYQTAATAGFNYFEAWFSTTTNGRVIFALSSTDGLYQIAFALSATGTLQVEWGSEASGLLVEAIATANLADGQMHHIVYEEKLAPVVYVDGVAKTGAEDMPPMYELRRLYVGGYKNTRLWNGAISHVALYTDAAGTTIGPLVDHYTAGTTAFEGEAADDRIQRIAKYAGLTSVTVWGSTHDPIAAQAAAGTSAPGRMREVESTESSRLFAERDYYGLAYQSRDVRYNPSAASEMFAIAYADLDTTGVEVADDDQKLINMVDASRPGGATQRVEAAESVLAFGRYEQSLDLLKTSDNSVLDAAYWLVSRYGNPGPELREVPIEAYTMPYYADILDADISSYFTVYDLPAQAPAPQMRVTIEGYSETIRDVGHHIQFRTSASATDSVWVLGDAAYSVLGTTSRLAY